MKRACPPARVSGQVELGRTVDQVHPVRTRLGDTGAVLTVLAAESPPSILIRFGERTTFKPAPGSSLVALSYRARNLGPSPLKPAYNLNRQAVLRDSSGELYRSAEATGCDVPLSASFSVAKHDTSPQAEVATGKATTTAVVFVVPENVKADALALPESDLAVRLHGNP